MEMSDKRKTRKSLAWIGSSQKDFRTFPDTVKDEMGYALYQAQMGGKSNDAKPLKGLWRSERAGNRDQRHGRYVPSGLYSKVRHGCLCAARFLEEIEKRD
jgi:hypothetical protein